MTRDARAFWLRAPGAGEIRPVTLPAPGADEVLVRTLYSGVSRGTETLVFAGRVPADQYATDARPVPGGRLPGPGQVRLPQRRGRRGGARRRCAGGPSSACTRTRPRTSCRPAAVVVVPRRVPAARAVLAGTVETAVNALWDAAPLVGDRVTVVGGGMVGCCVAAAAGPLPRGTGPAGRRRPGAGRGGRRARGRLRPARRRGRRPGPGGARQRHRRRPATVAGTARARRAPCWS